METRKFYFSRFLSPLAIEIETGDDSLVISSEYYDLVREQSAAYASSLTLSKYGFSCFTPDLYEGVDSRDSYYVLDIDGTFELADGYEIANYYGEAYFTMWGKLIETAALLNLLSKKRFTLPAKKVMLYYQNCEGDITNYATYDTDAQAMQAIRDWIAYRKATLDEEEFKDTFGVIKDEADTIDTIMLHTDKRHSSFFSTFEHEDLPHNPTMAELNAAIYLEYLN